MATGYVFSCSLHVLVFLGGLLVACQAAPLTPQSLPCTTDEGSPLNATDAFVSNKIIKLTVEELTPETEHLSEEVPAAFREAICPLFHHYTLHLLAHPHLNETDRITRNSLMTLLLVNLLELSCNHVKTSNQENEQLSGLNCTLSSLGQFCFRLDTSEELVDQLTTGATASILKGKNVESWLRKTVPDRQPQSSVLQTLSSVLLSTFIHCSIPFNATANQIHCEESLLLRRRGINSGGTVAL